MKKWRFRFTLIVMFLIAFFALLCRGYNNSKTSDENSISLEPLTIADVYGSHSMFLPVPDAFIKCFEHFEDEGTVPNLRKTDHSEEYGEYWDNPNLSLRLLYADADQDVFVWGFRDDQYTDYGLVIDVGEDQSLSYFPYRYTNNGQINPDFFLDETGDILTVICHTGGGTGVSVDEAYVFTLDCNPTQSFVVDLEALCKEVNERVKLTYGKQINCVAVSIDGATPGSYELTYSGGPKDAQLIPTQSFWGNNIAFTVQDDYLWVSFEPTLFSDQYPGATLYLQDCPEFKAQIALLYSDTGKIKDLSLNEINVLQKRRY